MKVTVPRNHRISKSTYERSTSFTTCHLDEENIQEILKKQITLQRGHWLEAGIQKALEENQLKLMPQLEISCYYNDVPIKAHLGFTLISQTPKATVRVLELKCTETIPDTELLVCLAEQ